jgi:putative heme transporter
MGIGDRFKRKPGKPRRIAGAARFKPPQVIRPHPAEEPVAPPPVRRSDIFSGAVAKVATWSWRLLLIAAALVAVAYVIGKLWVVILPALMGLLLATVLWPPTRVLRRYLPAAMAALLVLVAGIGALFGLGAILVPQVAGQWEELGDAVVGGLNDLRDMVSRPPFNLGQEQVNNLIDQAIGQLQSNAQSIAGGVLTGVVTAGSLLFNTILALVLCFFYLKDGPRFVPWLSGWVGSRAAPHISALSYRSWDTLSGFIKAQALVGFVDAVAIGIGLAILGVPLALPLAVLIFFGAFVPIIGAVVTGALAALVALVTNGLATALIVVGLVLVVQQLEGNVLQPILVGRTLDLHAALVILAVGAGSSLAGIVGAFLAVPIFAVVTAMVRYGREQLDRPAETPAAPSGAT